MTAPDIHSLAFAENPYPFYQTMLDYYPVFKDPVSQSWIVSRHRDVEWMLRSSDFSSRGFERFTRACGRTVLSLDGEEHSTHRRFLAPLLNGKLLHEKLEPAVHATAKVLVERVAQSHSMELVEDFSRWFGLNAIAIAMGVSVDDAAKFERWGEAIERSSANISNNPTIEAAAQDAGRQAREYFRPLVAARYAHPEEDLVSILTSNKDATAKLSADEILNSLLLLLIAGTHTVARSVTSLVKNLVEHPDQMAAVRSTPSLIDHAIEESMRFSPPLHLIPRRAARDLILYDRTIHADEDVLLFVGAANRDPRVFRDPDRFDIFRSTRPEMSASEVKAKHLSLGGGPHVCVGASLARLEIRVALELMFRTFDEIGFPEGYQAREDSLGPGGRAPTRLDLHLQPAACPHLQM